MSPRAHAVLHGFLLFHAAIWILWLAYAFVLASAPPERDWFVLREVAHAFVSGDLASVYSDRQTPDGMVFFQYPPFVLYAIAPLALVPPMVAYALVCAVELAAAAGMVVLLLRFARPPHPDLVVAGVFGCAAMAHVIVSGQNSALLALVAVAAAYASVQGRTLLSGALVGLLLCKPNWLPVFGAFVVFRGGSRALVAMAITCGALLLSTLPLGIQTWRDFVHVPEHVRAYHLAYPAFKEITLLAFLKSLGIPPALAMGVWAFTFAVLGYLLFRIWRSERPLGRQLAATALFAVALNPYASFYDGFLLTIPAALWYTHRDSYEPETWRRMGWVIAVYWLWDMGVFYYLPLVSIATGPIADPSVSLAGVFLYLWFRLELKPRRAAAG
jgi:hypothetical protein